MTKEDQECQQSRAGATAEAAARGGRVPPVLSKKSTALSQHDLWEDRNNKRGLPRSSHMNRGITLNRLARSDEALKDHGKAIEIMTLGLQDE